MKSSLFKIPLFEHFVEDQSVNKQFRNIDCNWIYRGIVDRKAGGTAGFNPFESTVYFGTLSRFAEWWRERPTDIRPLNFGDILVLESLLGVHDYLHAWAYQWIVTLSPQSNPFGRASINRQNLEKFVFCHILSEVVATVGLDYWYLSTLELDEILKVGTTLGPLTTTYHMRYDREFLQFNPEFKTQQKDFFSNLAYFYCSGDLLGFDLNEVKNSPRVFEWVQSEVTYGALQRSYARQWMHYLAGKTTKDSKTFSRPIDLTESWQKVLIEDIGELLWKKVKSNQILSCPIKLVSPRSRPPRTLDFRFLNRNQVSKTAARRSMHASRKFLKSQELMTYAYDSRASFGSKALKRLKKSSVNEPLDLFMLA